MTQWSNFTACTKPCGGGTKTRYRKIQTHPAGLTGKGCGDESHTVDCGVPNCPVDCEPQPWDNVWSNCTAECGWGTKKMTRGTKVEADFLGKTCEEQGIRLEVEIKCRLKMCPEHCQHTNWTKWTDCSTSCGDGYIKRTRKVTAWDRFGGDPCTGKKTEQTKPCNLGICPVHCTVSDWGSWPKQCTRNGKAVVCGGGTMKRTRSKITKADDKDFAGKARVCPYLEEPKDCAQSKCPIDCEMGDWGKWGKCSSKCGTGVKYRYRTHKREAQYGGKACTSYQQEDYCNEFVCPLPCVYGGWQGWTQCSKPCGNGTQTNTRSIDRWAQGTGTACDTDSLKQTRNCNHERCVTVEETCTMVWERALAAAPKNDSDACFLSIRAKLDAGTTFQQRDSGSCLWTYYTTMDIRGACPAKTVTEASVRNEYPNCEDYIVRKCKDIDCTTSHGIEIAQATGLMHRFNCPTPTEFSFKNSAQLKAKLPANFDINAANSQAAFVDALYDVTPLIAEKILEYRGTNGAFHNVDELRDAVDDTSIFTNFWSQAGTVACGQNGTIKCAKPVVTGAAPSMTYCTAGEQKTIDWWSSRFASGGARNIDASNGATLGAAYTGSLQGSVDLGAPGPWELTYEARASRGGAGDKAVLDVDGIVATVSRNARHVSQTIMDSKFRYNFQFKSSTDKYADHIGVFNAIATCKAVPKPCEMEVWDSWGPCSQECNLDEAGAGLQRRTRGVKKVAEYGGPCSDSQEQIRRCNDKACKWHAVLEAEDARLFACADLATAADSHGVDGTGFKGAGYVVVDNNCTATPQERATMQAQGSGIQWRVMVPDHGRYELQFRYSVPSAGQAHSRNVKITSDRLSVNYEYNELVHFSTGAGYDPETDTHHGWGTTSVTVDLYRGTNTLTIHVPYDVNTPYTVIDHMRVQQLQELQRCTLGQSVPLDWSTQTDNPGNKVSVTADSLELANNYYSGAVSGRLELPALGPWSLQFDVNGTMATEGADSVDIRVNSESSAKAHGGSVKKVAMPIHGGHVQYAMEWQSTNSLQKNHMRVGKAYAVCMGCSDTTCVRDPTSKRIVVRHPHGRRSGLGVYGSGELRGNHHKCEWNKLWEQCECTCSTLELNKDPTPNCKANERTLTSTFKDKDGVLKSLKRCHPCPYGTTAQGAECVHQAKDVWAPGTV
jgi:hypothetical protein